MRTELILAWRYLAVRRVRSILTTLSILLGVALIYGLNSLMPVFMEGFSQNLMAMSGYVDLSLTAASGSTFRTDRIDPMRQVDGVDAVNLQLRRNIVLSGATAPSGRNGNPIASLTITGVEPASFDSFHLPKTTGGAWLTDDTSGRGIVLSAPLADSLGMGVGDDLILPTGNGTMTFRVVGVMAQMPSAAKDELWMSLENAQNLFSLPGQALLAEFRFKTGADAQAVTDAILDAGGAGWSTAVSQTGSEFESALRMGNSVFMALGAIALLMGAFIIFVTFRTMVAEHRRDIGLLRAVGMTRGGVVRVILFEGLIQGVIGSVGGLLVGTALTWIMVGSIRGMWEDLTHQTLGRPALDFGLMALAIALGLVTTLVGGCVPAIGAARIQPLDALRPIEPMGTRITRRRTVAGFILLAMSVLCLPWGNEGLTALGMLLFFIGIGVAGPILVGPGVRVFGRLLAALFPSENGLAGGNLQRNPRRASATMMTVGIGMSLLVAVFGLVTSLLGAMEGYLDKSLGSDYIIYPQSIILNTGNVGAGPELLASIRSTEGVSDATSLKVTSAKAGSLGIQVVGVEPQAYARLSGLTFSQGSEDAWERLPSGEVILNGIMASATGLRKGDTVSLETGTGARDYVIAGVGLDFINAKINTVYMSQTALKEAFGEQPDMLLLANRTPGASEPEVRKRLDTALSGHPAFSLQAVEVYKNSLVGDLRNTMSSMYFLLVFLLLPSLIALVNTISISVIERTRELGVLRALGMLRKQMRAMITAESLLLSSLGVAIGMIGGVWMGVVLLRATATAGFPMEWSFPWTGLVAAAFCGVAFALVGARQPAKHAARLDVVKALQYE